MQRSFIAAAAAFAVLVASVAVAVAAEPRPDATPSPGPSSPARSADAPFCPLRPFVTDLDGTKTRYAVTFGGLETGLASGILSLYAENHRYDVPFQNAVVRDIGDDKMPARPIVVRFPAPVTLDGAAVTAVKDNGLAPCDPVFSPWVTAAAYPPGSPLAEKVRAQARERPPVDAPAPVDDPISCAVPYRDARTTFVFEPTSPYRGAIGISSILVLLGPDDRILGTRVVKTGGNAMIDRTAVDAAVRSRFEGSIFRCRHVFATYEFVVDFVD